MQQPTRKRPYLAHQRPLTQATTATRALTAITGTEDQVPLVRPYLADPGHRQARQAATRMVMLQTEHALTLLALIATVQNLDSREAK